MPLDTVADNRVAAWRQDIVTARIQLASAGLTRREKADLWRIVDCRELFIKLATRDFHAQLEKIDREIEDALRR